MGTALVSESSGSRISPGLYEVQASTAPFKKMLVSINRLKPATAKPEMANEQPQISTNK